MIILICFRLALALIWPGFLFLASILFLISSIPLCMLERQRPDQTILDNQDNKEESPVSEGSQPLLR